MRTCATMVMDSLSRIRFPQRGSLQDFEHAIQDKIKEIKARPQQNGRIQATILTIPIIFHIINNGEKEGSGMNISQAQVDAQVEVLNEDFRKMVGTPGYNTNPVGADIEIEFCLTPVDENGNQLSEPGIDRVNGHQTDWSRDQIEAQLKPSTIWNPNLFYNVWTVKFGSADALLLGYAQFPDQSGLPGLNDVGGPASTDGVVIRYDVCGSVDKGNFPDMSDPYDKGRTLTHETGHYLGLRHIWGDGPCSADDFVADTPPADAPNRGCPVGKVACGQVSMPQNYMDYSDDACMDIFTQGQKTRIQAVMELSPRRKSLVINNLCSTVVADVPNPNFTSDVQLVLLGGSVSFTDLSSNFPSSWSWSFPGGDPASSTERNPKVTYATAGTYDVSLVATNAIGTSGTLVQAGYITVSSEGLCNTMTNYKSSYTPSVLPLSNYGNSTGYLTGQNSDHITGLSEFFDNPLGYQYISGVGIKFGAVHAGKQDTTITVMVWNARGPQNGPGSVIERKEVLIKQIQDDVAAGKTTSVVFDRETPVFGRAFHVGLELNYDNGDSVAIISSADGEASTSSAWVERENGGPETGKWAPYALAYGANIAMNIKPKVGMNPSTQVSASKLLVYPGEEVTLNGAGASIFSWSSSDGTVKNVLGPQLIVHPTKTTTYTVTGSGLTLCNAKASVTIYVRTDVTGIEEQDESAEIRLFPTPGTNSLHVEVENTYRGPVELGMVSIFGQQAAATVTLTKDQNLVSHTFDVAPLASGLYIVKVKFGGNTHILKWIKK